MSKIVKFGSYNIQLKNVLTFKIGDKTFKRENYEKNFNKGDRIGEFYKLIKNNYKKVSYVLVSHFTDMNYWSSSFSFSYDGFLNTRQGGVTTLYLEFGLPHSFSGPAVSIVDEKETINRYYIVNKQLSYEDWIKLPDVKNTIRQKKLEKILC